MLGFSDDDLIDQSWLLILDNVVNSDLANDCWPKASHGSILVTARTHVVAIDPAAIGIQIGQFSETEGGALLRQRVGRYPNLESWPANEKDAAKKLSEQLGGHALALKLMAGQVRTRNKTFVEFLGFYQRNKERLHAETLGKTDKHEVSLLTCWGTAFDSLGSNASAILGVLAFIAPDDIPESLFQPGKSRSFPDALTFCDEEME